MSTTTKTIVGLVIALIVGFGAGYVLYHSPASQPSVAGASAGGKLIEQYDPYVRLNGGINTNLPITLGGGCIQTYATSTATSLALTFAASTTAPTNGSGVITVVSYGTCPNSL